MDNTPNISGRPASVLDSTAELRDTVRALRGLLYLTLFALILLASALFVVLYKQNSTLTYQIGELTKATENVMASSSAAEEFVKRLDEFANQDPNFRPIFSRYFSRGTPATRAPMEVSATNAPRLTEPPK